jgi:hypothetical protein
LQTESTSRTVTVEDDLRAAHVWQGQPGVCDAPRTLSTMNRADDRIQFIVLRVVKDEAMRLGIA